MTVFARPIGELNEHELMRAAVSSRDELFRRYLPRARRLALFCTREMDSAEEVVATAARHATIRFFTCRKSFRSWFLRIVRNKAADWVRARKRARCSPEVVPLGDPVASNSDLGSRDESLVELRWRLVDARLKLVAVLDRLPQKQRELFLAKISELSTADIAHHLEMTSTSSVHTAWCRLRAALRGAVGGEPAAVWKGAAT